MHVMVHPNCLIFISVLPLRFEDEIISELWISPQSSHAFHNIPMIKLCRFTLCSNNPSFESWAARKRVINDAIELIGSFV